MTEACKESVTYLTPHQILPPYSPIYPTRVIKAKYITTHKQTLYERLLLLYWPKPNIDFLLKFNRNQRFLGMRNSCLTTIFCIKKKNHGKTSDKCLLFLLPTYLCIVVKFQIHEVKCSALGVIRTRAFCMINQRSDLTTKITCAKTSALKHLVTELLRQMIHWRNAFLECMICLILVKPGLIMLRVA